MNSLTQLSKAILENNYTKVCSLINADIGKVVNNKSAYDYAIENNIKNNDENSKKILDLISQFEYIIYQSGNY